MSNQVLARHKKELTSGDIRVPAADDFSDRAEAVHCSGRPPVLRFKVEPGIVTVNDLLAGIHTFNLAAEVGDFPILRRDESPSYQLAVVVDDARDGVTEVLRGDDLLSSAARQQLLYQALALNIPRWVHVPLVTNAQGRRLAKRADDVSLQELRRSGMDPRALVSWVGSTIACDCQGLATVQELLKGFRVEGLSRHRVMVTPETFAPGHPRHAY